MALLVLGLVSVFSVSAAVREGERKRGAGFPAMWFWMGRVEYRCHLQVYIRCVAPITCEPRSGFLLCAVLLLLPTTGLWVFVLFAGDLGHGCLCCLCPFLSVDRMTVQFYCLPLPSQKVPNVKCVFCPLLTLYDKKKS